MPYVGTLLLFCSIFILTSCNGGENSTENNLEERAVEQTQDLGEQREPSRRGRRSGRREADALAQEFVGVLTSDGLRSGLFPIKVTGVSTAPIVEAADAFIGLFDDGRQKELLFEIDDQEWRKWSNVDNGIYERQGISLKEMNATQRASAMSLLRVSLSAKGLTQVQDIIKTEKTLSELNDNTAKFDDELYFFTIMGAPSRVDPWGWQFEGHHLVINYFVLGDQVVMSPVFMGGEPVVTETGVYAGNVILQPEQNLGLELMRMLDPDQRASASMGVDKTGTDIQAGALRDNLVIDYTGLQAKAMNEAQRVKLVALISLYVNNLRNPHAVIKLDEVMSHLDDTWFAWKGGVGDDDVFYYRIHSPVILIEFDHQGPVGVPNPSGDRSPTRNHIHTMVRTPNGGDYGKDLLRQHLQEHHQ